MKKIFLPAIALMLLSAFLINPQSPENNLADNRDGKVYRTVKIGDQTWMADNLVYNATGSKCYQNHANNCEWYGRLYNWEAAKVSCPEGWHLPSLEEWEKLVSNYSDNETAYKALMAGGPSGFNATLHGLYVIADNQFMTLKEHGAYWTSTEFNKERAWKDF